MFWRHSSTLQNSTTCSLKVRSLLGNPRFNSVVHHNVDIGWWMATSSFYRKLESFTISPDKIAAISLIWTWWDRNCVSPYVSMKVYTKAFNRDLILVLIELCVSELTACCENGYFQTLSCLFWCLVHYCYWDMTKNNLFSVYISWPLLPAFVTVTLWILLCFPLCSYSSQLCLRWIILSEGKQEHYNQKCFYSNLISGLYLFLQVQFPLSLASIKYKHFLAFGWGKLDLISM